MAERFLDVVVHDEVIEETVVLDLDASHAESLPHDLFALARTPAKAPLELLHRRRQDEDRDRLGDLRFDLAGALIVDVEDHPATLDVGPRTLDLGERGAVAVLVNVRPLEEGIAPHELVEV